jgi:hypothetical protein
MENNICKKCDKCMTKQGMWQDPYCCIGDCLCHSPKVELPEWDWEKEFDKEFEVRKYPDPSEDPFFDSPSAYNPDNIKNYIRQTLSLSTTQLVEKIKGECEELNSNVLTAEQIKEGVVDILNKYDIRKTK